MDSMSNLTRKNIPDDGGVTPTTEPGIVEGAPLVSAGDAPPQAATVKPGLDLPEFADVAYRTDVPEVVAAPTPAPEPAATNTPPVTPIPIPGGIMSAEDAKNAGLNVDDAKAIDVSQEQLAAEQRRFAEGQALKMRETTDMLAGALAEEEARAKRFENTENADAETREKLLGEDPKVVRSIRMSSCLATVMTTIPRRKSRILIRLILIPMMLSMVSSSVICPLRSICTSISPLCR